MGLTGFRAMNKNEPDTVTILVWHDDSCYSRVGNIGIPEKMSLTTEEQCPIS